MTLRPPSIEVQALIRKELREDSSTRSASLQAIKEWLSKEPHLPDTWDEVALLNFLRGCSFSLEKCKRKLDLYFTMRAALPELFVDRDIRRPELQAVTKRSFAPPLPILTPEGRRVTILGLIDNNWTHVFLEDALKVFFMVQDIRLVEEKHGVAGDVLIFDTADVTPALAARLTPGLVRKIITCGFEAYPVKIKELHVINVHPLVVTVFRWVKQFLKEKLLKRVHFHTSGYETLYEFVPRHVLPEEYGGTSGKILDFHEDWQVKFKEYITWFKEQEKFKADESKRSEEIIDHEGIFGVDGSFKQLTVD